MSRSGAAASIVMLLAAGVVVCYQASSAPAQTPANQPRSPSPAGEGRVAPDGHGADRTKMSDARLAAAKIALERAQMAVLSDTLVLNGVIRANQETLVQVTPRFPGIARQILKRIGDRVRQDELMAKIESNQSLTSYDLKAPLAGTVIDRQISLGEYASEQKPAFVVADLSSVWVELSVYRQDLARVRVGDELNIDLGDGSAPVRSSISYVSPVGSTDTQSALVRAVVPNPEGRLRPGLFVRGKVVLGAKQVPIAVKLSALQTMENKTVVFVREGDLLEARAVKVGDQDKDYAEIVDGLSIGELYAADNSFVVKAEIGKGAADH